MRRTLPSAHHFQTRMKAVTMAPICLSGSKMSVMSEEERDYMELSLAAGVLGKICPVALFKRTADALV